jgi:hypothetical protein
MAPISQRGSFQDEPPSRIAQVGLFWNISTALIDFGLSVFDMFIVVQEWVRNREKKEKKKAKAEKYKRPRPPETLRNPRPREFKRIWE